ncbi:hypothetical protein [Streptomyces sp. NPDC093600]|uniref:hypothetical protein n=1 Tax=Streptomyces sp. NPDC093600 TaxID=3366047 RepID=UPI0038261626
MKEPAKDIIVSAELERPGKSTASKADLSSLQIAVFNAAARRVSAELGCGDVKLAGKLPAEERP